MSCHNTINRYDRHDIHISMKQVLMLWSTSRPCRVSWCYASFIVKPADDAIVGRTARAGSSLVLVVVWSAHRCGSVPRVYAHGTD